MEGDKDVNQLKNELNPFAHSHFPNSSSTRFWASPYLPGVASGRALLQFPAVAGGVLSSDCSSGFIVRNTVPSWQV